MQSLEKSQDLNTQDILHKGLAAHPTMAAPPVTVRLAGLPARVIEPLTSPQCLGLLQEKNLLEERLAAARKSMVERIGVALAQFDPETRRFLLVIKRSCFNQREIGIHRGKVKWAELLQISSGLAESIVTLEDQLREQESSFNSVYESELFRERRHIIDLTQDRRFLRGIAIGRMGLVQKIRAQASSPATMRPLKPAKWEHSLLRFVTRAATKLSANSTLTTYALGSIQDQPSFRGFRFADSRQREISLVRANRPELEKLQALLIRHPAVRERCLIAWNSSLEELEPGRYRFLRGGHWDLDTSSTEFRFVQPARVTVTLSNPVLPTVRQALGNGEVQYERLLALLPSRHEPSARAAAGPSRSALDELIDLGLLLIMPPWPAYEPWLEKRIGKLLLSLPATDSMGAVAQALEKLVLLEEGFASSPRPESAVTDLEDLLSRALETVASLSGGAAPYKARAEFFEDVFLEAVDGFEDGHEILQVSAATVQGILNSACLVSRFAGLFNHRHDVLHTLAAWWRDHEPSRREIPFTEVAKGFSSLWKQYISFHRTANQSSTSTFDPLHTPALGWLRERRERLLEQSQDLASFSPTKDRLPAQQFATLLDSLPLRYAPLLGTCVFVQPADSEGNSWVLNHLHEGTGRYLSRITPVLRGPLQRRLLNHLIESSAVRLGEEEADLLEVMNPWGNLVNAHLPQASKVLDVQGLHLDLPQERKVRIEDLTIQADLESETFRLLDPSGRRVLPANLSSLADIWHPNLLRFLLVFGPGETRGVFPLAYSEGDDDFRIFRRLTCGSLVLRRRRWTFEVESLRGLIEGLSEPGAYRSINNWRLQHDLPTMTFYFEHTYQGGLKPQFLDFSSPALCGLFAASLRRAQIPSLRLEEALPSPIDFPFDASMHQRGFELSIDSLAVATVNGNSSTIVPDHNREKKSLRRDEQHG